MPLSIYLVNILYPITIIAFSFLGGIGYFVFPLFAWTIVPILEHVIDFGKLYVTHENTQKQGPRTPAHKKFQTILFINFILYFTVFCWGAWMGGAHALPPYANMGIILSVGLFSGTMGVATAHDLIHQTRSPMRYLGQAILVGMGHLSYAVEHLHGHHVNVAKASDPSTAMKGESLYHFLVRSAPRLLGDGFRIVGVQVPPIAPPGRWI